VSADELNRILEPQPIDGAKVLATAAWCRALSFVGHHRAASEIVERDLNVKRLLRHVEKADQTVGTTTTSGWASQLVQTSVADFFSTITGMSAGARLIETGTKIDLGGGTVLFPVASATPIKVGWVNEADPIPVWSGTAAQNTLGPHRKMAAIVVVSRELLRRGVGGLATFEAMLRERVAESIDAAIFSNDAGTTEVHPGLRYGVTPMSGSGESFPEDALQKLVAGLADKGGSGNVAVVAAPRTAATLRFLHPTIGIPIWSTRQLPAGTVIALDPLAFASAIGTVEFDVSENATVHMADPASAIVAANGTVADPTRSLYQTDCIALRVIIDIAFTQRAGLITILENVSW
jgi:HK97 family phage major capsid protein